MINWRLLLREKGGGIKQWLFAIVGFGLCLPYLLLFQKISSVSFSDAEELWWALKNSVLLAAGTGLISLFVGFWLSWGLFDLRIRIRKWASLLLLVPSFLPPLFVLLSFMSWVDPFPMGWIGVIALQGYIYSGVVAVLLLGRWESSAGTAFEAGWIMGASHWQCLWALRRSVVRELGLAFVFVFISVFASFSIPFVVGGGRMTNLEILIYEKIRISNSWGEALGLSLIQLALLFCFVFLPRDKNQTLLQSAGVDRKLWRHPFLKSGIWTWVGCFWLPMILFFGQGLAALEKIDGLITQILHLFWGTLLVALVGGLASVGGLAVLCFGGARNQVGRLMQGWMAPSTALLGFGFVFFSSLSSWVSYLLAVLISFLPSLYRWGLDQKLQSLESQLVVAETLGADDLLIFKRIILPQMWKTLWTLGGVMSLWILGEFALQQIIFERVSTWAALSQSLVSNYRIDAGLGVGVLILLLSGVLYSLFWSVGHVGHKKFSS